MYKVKLIIKYCQYAFKELQFSIIKFVANLRIYYNSSCI